MKKIHLIILLFLLELSLSAQAGKTWNVTFPIQIKLKSKSIPTPPKFYGKMSSILIFNNLLISIEPYNDTIFSIFELPNCNFISSFGINGRGPNEFATPDSRNAFVTKNGITFKDLSERFISIDLTNYLKNRTYVLHITKLPGELEILNNSFWLNDSTICGLPYIGGRFNKPYIRYNINTKKIDPFGIWPNIYPHRKETEKQSWIIYAGRSRVKPDQSMFVTFMFNIKMFRIYMNSGELFKEIILETQDNFFEGNEIRSYPKMYYTCIRTTDKYIFALNTACSIAEMPKKVPTLEIWDWNGKPIAEIQLDIPVNQFDITQDGKLVYCNDWNTMDKLYIYDVSGIIK